MVTVKEVKEALARARWTSREVTGPNLRHEGEELARRLRQAALMVERYLDQYRALDGSMR